MKIRILALALCLTLVVSGTALAAPTRDQKQFEITVTDTLQAFLDLCMGAAVLKGETVLENGAAPSQAYTEGVFGVGLYSLVLPYEGDDIWENRAILTEGELQSLYNMVFAAGSYAVPESSDCECIMINEKDVAFDLSPLAEAPTVGAYIYKTAFDGSVVTVYCDLFTHYGALSTSAADVPDDALTWYANAAVTLRTDEKAPYGYLLTGFEIGEEYADGMISEWKTTEHEALGLSFTAPAIFGLAEMTDEGLYMETADGSATISLGIQDYDTLDFESHVDEYVSMHSSKTVLEDREFTQFTAQGSGEYTIYIVNESENRVYWLSIGYDDERTAEFTLYGELIRNSFVVWSMANG